jgi:hypothetical protein
LDGVVNANDFQMFLDGFSGANAAAWGTGDYTYDGKVDLGNDFNLFLTSFLFSGGQLGDLAAIVNADSALSNAQRASLLALVPEPSSVTAIGLALAGLMTRRRRKE